MAFPNQHPLSAGVMPAGPECILPWKRVLDISVVLLVLPLLVPLMVVVAVLIRVVSAGPRPHRRPDGRRQLGHLEGVGAERRRCRQRRPVAEWSHFRALRLARSAARPWSAPRRCRWARLCPGDRADQRRHGSRDARGTGGDWCRAAPSSGHDRHGRAPDHDPTLCRLERLGRC